MGEIPGARQRLDRLSQSLRVRLTELVAQLTPQAGNALFMPAEPKVVDWHEPLRYQYSATARGERPVSEDLAAFAGRAGQLLLAAGWEAVEERSADGGVVVTGRHEGNVIEILLSDDEPGVLYKGRTPALPLSTATAPQRPEPVRTSGTVSEGHVLCYECDGLGWCPTCAGRGWVPDAERGQRPCPECLRERVCPVCRGAGQLYIADLRPSERAMYPELRETPK
ncbi:hypothetical protein [Nocardia sp. NPDC050406]|uniref:hypothetical protein n=1 Tax=Nocardia sp. NPDC050406 TaxID=3364318 RepID=UPI00379456C9